MSWPVGALHRNGFGRIACFADSMDLLLSRATVIALAIIGALFSVAASVLRARGMLTEARADMLNRAGYIVMGVSMALFIWIGLRGGRG